MAPEGLRIGTRGSELALWQAHWVEAELRRLYPALAVTVTVIRTTGDRILDAPLSNIGDKGLFTREIENALLSGEIDLAVHSLKDLPTSLPEGLALAAVSRREDLRDVFLPHPANPERTLLGQPQGSTIATGSLRRRCQILHHRPDLRVVDLRGNLNTRLQKLDGSTWAGMLLARAGVVRLGWEKRVGETLDPLTVLPAVGQGALGLEIRDRDAHAAALLSPLHDTATASATGAERALLRRLEGGCQIPIGAYGRLDQRSGRTALVLDAMVGSLDGRAIVRARGEGSPDRPEELGEKVAGTLLDGGAGPILEQIRTPR